MKELDTNNKESTHNNSLESQDSKVARAAFIAYWPYYLTDQQIFSIMKKEDSNE